MSDTLTKQTLALPVLGMHCGRASAGSSARSKRWWAFSPLRKPGGGIAPAPYFVLNDSGRK